MGEGRMNQIIITILLTPETGQVGMTIGSTEGSNVSYKEVALALIKALESFTAGLGNESASTVSDD